MIVQVIWSVDLLRESISKNTNKADADLILDELRRIFEDNKEIVETKNLRLELFKSRYLTKAAEKFELYEKADAAEFLDCIIKRLPVEGIYFYDMQ